MVSLHSMTMSKASHPGAGIVWSWLWIDGGRKSLLFVGKGTENATPEERDDFVCPGQSLLHITTSKSLSSTNIWDRILHQDMHLGRQQSTKKRRQNGRLKKNKQWWIILCKKYCACGLCTRFLWRVPSSLWRVSRHAFVGALTQPPYILPPSYPSATVPSLLHASTGRLSKTSDQAAPGQRQAHPLLALPKTESGPSLLATHRPSPSPPP